jgi:D-glycero-alpha-D-manno-heptose-7-phosphate kinase
MADDAINIERGMIGDNVGDQDQMAAAHGGFNIIQYDSGGRHVSPCVIGADARERLSRNLVLVFTGLSRYATDIAKEQVRTIGERLAELDRMKKLVDEAQGLLASGDCDGFGRLLHETWMIKRTLTGKISSPEIDALYDAALESGALGGKLLGAGGGGFLLFYVPDEAKPRFNDRFRDYVRVPVGFDYDGTRVIYLTDEVQ